MVHMGRQHVMQVEVHPAYREGQQQAARATMAAYEAMAHLINVELRWGAIPQQGGAQSFQLRKLGLHRLGLPCLSCQHNHRLIAHEAHVRPPLGRC